MRLVVIAFSLIALAFAVERSKAQRFDAPSLADSGPYTVGTIERTIESDTRPLTVTIWYPAEGDAETVQYPILPPLGVEGFALRDAMPLETEDTFPLVIFSHGSGGSRVLSLFLTEHLASHGFVVMAADHPGNGVQESVLGQQNFVTNYAQRPDDILRQLNYAADVLNADDGFLSGLIDTDNVGVSGHSFGGWTALSAGGARMDFEQLRAHCADVTDEDNTCFVSEIETEIAAARGIDSAPDGIWKATTDPRIKAIAAFAPWNAPVLNLDEIEIPTLIAVGTRDLTTPAERDAFIMFERLSSTRTLLTMELGGHYLFIDECPDVLIRFGAQATCTDPVWDMQRAHDIINHVTTAFLLEHLAGNSEAAALLDPDQIDFTGVRYERVD